MGRAIKQPIYQTLKTMRAKCTIAGGHWLWDGAMTRDGIGEVRHGFNLRSARAVMWELANGKPLPKDMVCICTCEHVNCISPKCIQAVTFAEKNRFMAQRGVYAAWTDERREKCRQTRRKNSRFTEELIDQVRYDPRPARAVAMEVGMSPSHAKQIRNGRSWAKFDPWSHQFGRLAA